MMQLLRLVLGVFETLPSIRPIIRPIFRLRRLSVMPIKPVGSVADVDVTPLFPPSRYESTAPRAIGTAGTVVEGTFPAISARRVRGAVVNCHSSALLLAGQILLPDHAYENRGRITSAGGHLRADGQTLGVVENTQTEDLPAGIAVFGNGAFNYYHWLIEILPAAFMSQHLPSGLDDFPFLVPDQYNSYQSFRDSLALVGAGRPVVSLRPDCQYRVGDLIVIDSPAHGPFNLRSGIWPNLTDYGQNADVLRLFAEAILRAAGVASPSPDSSRKIFLARDNTRRAYNQDEIIDVVRDCGFEEVCPERLSFLEQVRLFNSATVIVGPSGAAWANMLFCRPGSKGLTWVFPEYRGFCAYSNLARMVGMDLECLFPGADRRLASTGDAYVASYTVDPVALRAALRSLSGG